MKVTQQEYIEEKRLSEFGLNNFIKKVLDSLREELQRLRKTIYEYDKDLIVMGLSGSEMIKAAKDCGLKSASEVFADRAYEEDGTLVNRRKPGAMIEDEDEAINRVIRMIKEGKVTSITGKDIDIKADSVCVHGDGEKALLFVEKIRKTFGENEIEICHL